MHTAYKITTWWNRRIDTYATGWDEYRRCARMTIEKAHRRQHDDLQRSSGSCSQRLRAADRPEPRLRRGYFIPRGLVDSSGSGASRRSTTSWSTRSG